MRSSRSRAASRVIQPRSTATISAMTPKPEPPIVTASSSAARLRDVRRSKAKPLDGMGAFPKIAEGLTLDDFEQRGIFECRELGWITRRSRGGIRGLRAWRRSA